MKFRFFLLSLFFVFASCMTPKEENNKINENPFRDRDFESTSITETAYNKLAKSNFNNKNIIFYIPCDLMDCSFSIEGLSEEESQCILSSYNAKKIDVGNSDMILTEEEACCYDKKANWIRKYNSQLILLLKKSKNYKCSM